MDHAGDCWTQAGFTLCKALNDIWKQDSQKLETFTEILNEKLIWLLGNWCK